MSALHTTKDLGEPVAEWHTDTLEDFDRVRPSIRWVEGISDTSTAPPLRSQALN